MSRRRSRGTKNKKCVCAQNRVMERPSSEWIVQEFEKMKKKMCVETLKKKICVSTEEGSGGPRHRVDHAGV